MAMACGMCRIAGPTVTPSFFEELFPCAGNVDGFLRHIAHSPYNWAVKGVCGSGAQLEGAGSW